MKRTILIGLSKILYYTAEQAVNKCIFWAHQEKITPELLELRNIDKSFNKKE